MSGFNGRTFLLGIAHLDSARRELFADHGKSRDGRLGLIDQITDDAMLRLVGSELGCDPYDRERY
jgi:hypothetical protein